MKWRLREYTSLHHRLSCLLVLDFSMWTPDFGKSMVENVASNHQETQTSELTRGSIRTTDSHSTEPSSEISEADLEVLLQSRLRCNIDSIKNQQDGAVNTENDKENSEYRKDLVLWASKLELESIDMKQLIDGNTKLFNETLEKLKAELVVLSKVAADLSKEGDAKVEHLTRSVGAKIGSLKTYLNKELEKLKTDQNNDQNESSIKKITKEIDNLKVQQEKFMEEGERQTKMLDKLSYQLQSQKSTHETDISQLKEMMQAKELSFESEIGNLRAQVESQQVKITYLEGQLTLQTRKSIQLEKDLKKNKPKVQKPPAEKTANSTNTSPKITAKIPKVAKTVKHPKVAKTTKNPKCKNPKETSNHKKNHHETAVIVRL
ncbi:unnamed protein product [Ambrosiozyma monospora]|uniref:Unnamed protein product n=1 Tax=Ambrosiozyma monospora TaxID=43982 RepID=A0A9W6YM35_AMBMO|nr:unnamed protein product [Ambrosiozyma monospora]